MKNYIREVHFTLFKDASEFIHLMALFVKNLGSTPLVSNKWHGSLCNSMGEVRILDWAVGGPSC
jgi:hypothetical protein